MKYSLEQITTIEDCDILLEAAQIARQDLDLRKLQQEKQYRTVTTGTSGIDAALMAVVAELSALETVVATLPEGPTKSEMTTRVMVLGVKKRQLEDRREKYGVIALLQKEHAITNIDHEIVENGAYISAINERKGAL